MLTLYNERDVLKRALGFACTKIALRDRTCPPIRGHKILNDCNDCEKTETSRAHCWYKYLEALGANFENKGERYDTR